MSNHETVTTGRAKRSTAGNRMRELLEKAHQDDEDELFKEVEDDEDFTAPQEVKDVFLDEFADTDEEAENDDEEAEERAIRREERKKAKGKGKTIYDPLSALNKNKLKSISKSGSNPTDKLLTDPSISLLDPSIDVSAMAPSTLLITLRRQRRELKREQRVESRRSNLRASTLNTEKEILEREKEEQERLRNSKKGRKAQHLPGGEVRGLRPMTQFELIEAALIEEERNKEALRDWLKKEDEKRELRKISRKRVRGPRITWVSRTVGKLVEVVEDQPITDVKQIEETLVESEDRDTQITDGNEKTAEGGKEISKNAIPENAESVQDGQVIDGNQVPSNVIQEEPDPAQVGQVKASEVPKTPSTDEATSIDKTVPPVEFSAGAENILPASKEDKIAIDPAQPPASNNDKEITASSPAQTNLPGSDPTVIADTGQRSVDQSNEAAAPKSPTSITPITVNASSLPEKIVENPPAAEAGPSNSDSQPISVPDPSDKPISIDPPNQTANTPSSSEAGPSKSEPQPDPVSSNKRTQEILPSETTTDESKYTRNYLILSQIPGGLTEEIKLILGDHVEWDQVVYIPARNRPMNRKPPICPFTGLVAKYRHPVTMIPYATPEGYKHIEALLHQRYKYDEGGWWIGGEEDIHADGMEDIEGWWENVNGGWLGGKEIPLEPEAEEELPLEEVPPENELFEEEEEEVEVVKGKRKRGKQSASSTPVPTAKKSKGRGRTSAIPVEEPAMSPELIKKPKTKGKKK